MMRAAFVYLVVGVVTALSVLAINALASWIKTTMGAERTLAESSTPIDSQREAGGQREADRIYPILVASPSVELCERCLHPSSDVGALTPTDIVVREDVREDVRFTLALCADCRQRMLARPLTLVHAVRDLSDMEIEARVLPFPDRRAGRGSSQGLVS